MVKHPDLTYLYYKVSAVSETSWKRVVDIDDDDDGDDQDDGDDDEDE